LSTRPFATLVIILKNADLISDQSKWEKVTAQKFEVSLYILYDEVD